MYNGENNKKEEKTLPNVISTDKVSERLQPEELEVAESYIAAGFSLTDTAEVLGISREDVADILGKRPVKKYIDQIIGEYGYNNHFKLSALIEKVIDKKIEELEEAEIGSSKDIADLINLAIKWTKVRSEMMKEEQKIGKQTNVQINEMDGHYRGFMEQLLKE